MSGEIDYDKHRDHAVHTVYNYLLGWYIFDHLQEVRKSFRQIFENKLEIGLNASYREEEFYNKPEYKKYLPD
jgi:hypothetical protein